MSLRLKLLLVSALTCAMLVPLTPGAFAAKKMEVAVQDDSALVTELQGVGSRAAGLDLASQLHATWIRANVNWNYVVGATNARKRKAPKNIVYNWTGYDALIDQAAAKGIHVQLALTGPAPAYATANHRIGVKKPKARPYKAFVSAAAAHFRGRVTRFSIWNEPNYKGWISPLSAGPRVYRALYLAGYSAIKKAAPGAQVLIAETQPYALKKRSTAPLKFLRGVTCAKANYHKAKKCKRLKADGFAHHPYDFGHKPTYKYRGKDNVTLATLSRLTNALKKLKKAKLLTTPRGGVPPLYLTEYGYKASGKQRVSASKHAKYLVQAFKIARKNPNVKQMLQFLLLQPPSSYRFFDTSIATGRTDSSTIPGTFLPSTITTSKAFKKLATWASKAARAGQIATK